VNVLDVATTKIMDRHKVSDSTIHCLAAANNVIVAGSERGLETINPATLVSLERDMIFTEQISAVAAPSWGVISGSRDGILRRWTINQHTLQRYGSNNLKVGKSVQRMLLHADRVLVAAGHGLHFIDEELQVIRKMSIDFIIKDMCLLSHATLILCGDGKLAHVNLSKGIYTRFFAASDETQCTCVAGIDENTFCAGTEDGALSAIDLQSNSEIGNAKLLFPIRGMIKMQSSLVAYGGNWSGRSKNTIAVLTWDEILHKAKEVADKF
jgi:hypothetical protein